MNPIDRMKNEILVKLGEIQDICAKYQYDVDPNLFLSHREDGESSMIIARIDAHELGQRIQNFANFEGNIEFDKTTTEAAVDLIFDDATEPKD